MKPDDARVRDRLAWQLNNLAWSLATHPAPARREPERAQTDATEADGLKPQEGSFCNTLGTALYRVGRWKDAIETLEKADQLLEGKWFGHNAFFIAMAHWQLDEKDKAREWYDRAVVWMDANQPKDEELGRFRAEAAELLGLKEAN